ncbi:MAG: phospholipid/cholesterol/gamma-HCH transport system substrate-binding protein, partial [Mycobacterium sp.]|nr:phospholipid/cholesterol/gamma-HCH transport system substrate-binding protein [Mycobacterium sp.]
GQPIEALPPAEPPPPADGAVPAAPSAFSGNPSRGTVAVAHYDPATGKYMTPDGRLEQQTNLVAGAAPKSWQDLLPT